MAYLSSKNVSVFPIAKERGKEIEETRLLTEHNLSGIIRQLLPAGVTGFVQSAEKLSDGSFKVLFNLYGYQFHVEIPQSVINEQNFTRSDGLYASIVVDTVIDEIDGQDVNQEYRGLHITTSVPTLQSLPIENVVDKELKTLKILNYSSGVLSPITGASFFGYSIGGIDGKY